MDLATIKPGVGVGDIHLKTVPGDIVELLGEPDSKDPGTDTEGWVAVAVNQ